MAVSMSRIENVSRRGFLQGLVSSGALVLGARFYPKVLWADGLPHDTHADHATLHPNVFVGVDTDGTVYIVAHRSEMGTGIRTSLPLVVAEEMDADWKRVRIEQAVGDSRYGDQNTDGSHSIRSFFEVMREAGATARFMLIQAAALEWHVPPSKNITRRAALLHQATRSGVLTSTFSGRISGAIVEPRPCVRLLRKAVVKDCPGPRYGA